MSRKSAFLAALVLAPLLFVAELLLHEAVHAAINFAATGQIASCGEGLGPFVIRNGRMFTCYVEGGVPAWNNLLTPTSMALLGLAAVHYSPRVPWLGARWAVAFVGISTWVFESLYSLGMLAAPRMTADGVVHAGDGVAALEAFGRIAQLPGVLLLGLGVWIVMGRVEYHGKTDSSARDRGQGHHE